MLCLVFAGVLPERRPVSPGRVLGALGLHAGRDSDHLGDGQHLAPALAGRGQDQKGARHIRLCRSISSGFS